MDSQLNTINLPNKHDSNNINEIHVVFFCYKQKIIQFIWGNQVYFSSSNVSTDTTVIVKD